MNLEMNSYSEQFELVNAALDSFVQTGKIDGAQIEVLNEISERAKGDQFRILNQPYLSINDQRVLFSAFRNISQSTEIMKVRLQNASKIGENPTTAEVSLELTPLYLALGSYIDDFSNKKEVFDSDKIFLFSRNLYKKAKKFGFLKDTSSQLEELRIAPSIVDDFVETFTNNVSQEIEIEEEVAILNEDSNRNLNSS